MKLKTCLEVFLHHPDRRWIRPSLQLSTSPQGGGLETFTDKNAISFVECCCRHGFQPDDCVNISLMESCQTATEQNKTML